MIATSVGLACVGTTNQHSTGCQQREGRACPRPADVALLAPKCGRRLLLLLLYAEAARTQLQFKRWLTLGGCRPSLHAMSVFCPSRNHRPTCHFWSSPAPAPVRLPHRRLLPPVLPGCPLS